MQYIELSPVAAFLLRVNIITAPVGLVNIIAKPACYRPAGAVIGRAKRAPHCMGCSIEISRGMSVGMYVCMYSLSRSKKRRRKYVGQTRACSKSVLCGKIRPVTPVLLISTIRYSSFSMDGRETFT